jgi:hypothetical protein
MRDRNLNAIKIKSNKNQMHPVQRRIEKGQKDEREYSRENKGKGKNATLSWAGPPFISTVTTNVSTRVHKFVERLIANVSSDIDSPK